MSNPGTLYLKAIGKTDTAHSNNAVASSPSQPPLILMELSVVALEITVPLDTVFAPKIFRKKEVIFACAVTIGSFK